MFCVSCVIESNFLRCGKNHFIDKKRECNWIVFQYTFIFHIRYKCLRFMLQKFSLLLHRENGCILFTIVSTRIVNVFNIIKLYKHDTVIKARASYAHAVLLTPNNLLSSVVFHCWFKLNIRKCLIIHTSDQVFQHRREQSITINSW